MTENNISSASDTITMYCTQPDLVWNIVDKDGVNYVKQAYITKNIKTLPGFLTLLTSFSARKL